MELFHDIFLQTLNELDQLCLFRLGYLELRQGLSRMTKKHVPIALVDAHASMSEGHVPAAIVHWPTRTGAEVVNEELLLALDAVLRAMGPETPKLRIGPKSWEEVVRHCADRIVTAKALIESRVAVAHHGLLMGRITRQISDLSSRTYRNRERERRALAHLALHPDPPAVQFDELTAQGQPQPRPFRLLVGRPDLAELLEYRVLVLGRDPNAGVDDRNFDGSITQHGPDFNPPALRRELDRIGQQVQDDLPDLPFVCPDLTNTGVHVPV